MLNYYEYGEDGYYVGPVTVQVDEFSGKPNLPPRTVPIAPDFDLEENWAKWDESSESWVAEAKPKTAADLEGKVISHYTESDRDREMRDFVHKLTENNSDYREARGDDLSWYVQKVPDEEKQASAIQATLSNLDSEINNIKDRLSMAILADDQELIDELKTQYKAMMTGTMVSTLSLAAVPASASVKTEEDEPKRYCSACGAELDADGVCSNELCPRRPLQLKINELNKIAQQKLESQKEAAAAAMASAS